MSIRLFVAINPDAACRQCQPTDTFSRKAYPAWSALAGLLVKRNGGERGALSSPQVGARVPSYSRRSMTCVAERTWHHPISGEPTPFSFSTIERRYYRALEGEERSRRRIALQAALRRARA